MKKAVLVSGLLAASAIAYKVCKNRLSPTCFEFDLIEKKLENSGYSIKKTKDRGVFVLEKNAQKSLLIYDNTHFSEETLFNLLDKYQALFTPQLYILSDTTNSLFAKTKTHFFRWASTKYSHTKPLIVHFSTLQKIKQLDEPSWETVQI